MMKILITGSNGFVGGSVGRYAARAGHEVWGVARAGQPAVNWPGGYAQADVVTSDLSPIIDKFAPDVLLHAAGTASVGASLQAPLDDLRAAVLTFANTLDGVRRATVKPLVIFTSSAAVYGQPAETPAGEETPARPISPYGYHKAACELLAREYAECFGLEVVCCRLFSPLGPAQRRLLVWELFQQLAGPAPAAWLQGTGAEMRDYLYIDDAAEAMLALAEARRRAVTAEGCLMVNVASGQGTSVIELARQLRDAVAPAKEIHCGGVERPGDPRCWCADISRFRALVPRWQPRPLTLALAQCVSAWRGEPT